MLVRCRTIMLRHPYHLTTRKFPSMVRNMHFLFTRLGFSQSNHLPLRQVASKCKRACLIGWRFWLSLGLAPVPPPKGKSILGNNACSVNIHALSIRRWLGRIGICCISLSIHSVMRWLLLALLRSSTTFYRGIILCK